MKLLGDWNWYLPRWLIGFPRLEHGGSIQPQEPAASRQGAPGPEPHRPLIGEAPLRQACLPEGSLANGVLDDRPRDGLPVGAVEPVAGALKTFRSLAPGIASASAAPCASGNMGSAVP